MATIEDLEKSGEVSALLVDIVNIGRGEYEKELQSRKEKLAADEAKERVWREESNAKMRDELSDILPKEIVPYIAYTGQGPDDRYEFRLHIPTCAPIRFWLEIDRGRIVGYDPVGGPMTDNKNFLVPRDYRMQPLGDQEDFEYLPTWDRSDDDCWYALGAAIGAAQAIWKEAAEKRQGVEQAYTEERQRQLAQKSAQTLEQEKPSLEERQVMALERIAHHLERFNL